MMCEMVKNEKRNALAEITRLNGIRYAVVSCSVKITFFFITDESSKLINFGKRQTEKFNILNKQCETAEAEKEIAFAKISQLNGMHAL